MIKLTRSNPQSQSQSQQPETTHNQAILKNTRPESPSWKHNSNKPAKSSLTGKADTKLSKAREPIWLISSTLPSTNYRLTLLSGNKNMRMLPLGPLREAQLTTKARTSCAR